MLKGYQKQFLRGSAHAMSPLVQIGQKGCTPELLKEIDVHLEKRELIKIKFVDLKEKDQKNEILAQITTETSAEVAGTVGHTAVLYRQNKDPQKRTIVLPVR